MTTMTRSELFALVYRFYPRGLLHMHREHVAPGEPVYADTEEHRRLVEASNRGRAEYPTWKAMALRLWPRYRLQDESVRLLAGWVSPAYSARIYRPKDLEPVPSLKAGLRSASTCPCSGPIMGSTTRASPTRSWQ